jgi:hypothetical protein
LIFLALLLDCSQADPVSAGYNAWTTHGPEGGCINALYVATFGAGVFKSMDGGGEWSEASSGLSDTNVRTLAIDPDTAANL